MNSLALMDTVLADEKPDYVYVLGLFSLFLVSRMLHEPRVLTDGDLITKVGRESSISGSP